MAGIDLDLDGVNIHLRQGFDQKGDCPEVTKSYMSMKQNKMN